MKARANTAQSRDAIATSQTGKTRKRYASFQFGADGGAKWRVRKPERARDEIGMRARPARRRPENEGGVTDRIKRV